MHKILYPKGDEDRLNAKGKEAEDSLASTIVQKAEMITDKYKNNNSKEYKNSLNRS